MDYRGRGGALDFNGRIKTLNDAASRMLGIPVGVATDRLFADSTTPVVLGVATSAAVGGLLRALPGPSGLPSNLRLGR